jgi:poly(3-hydroxybutyrate) depolymerase
MIQNLRHRFAQSGNLARSLVIFSILIAFSPFSFSQNLLTNPGFENNTSGWTLEREASAQYTESGGRSGSRLTHWSSRSAYQAETRQTVTGLSAGTYRLSAYTIGGNTAGAWLWAYCNGQSFSTPIPSSAWNSWTQVSVENIQVTGTSCVVGITTENSEWTSIDDVVFEPVSVSSGGNTEILLQENAAGFCSVDGTVDSNHDGFTGSGFANTANVKGNGVEWQVDVSQAGTYGLQWRYANGGKSGRPGDVFIDGKLQYQGVPFPETGSWSNWADSPSAELWLDQGSHTVRLQATAGEGLSNIDSFSISGNSSVSGKACQSDGQAPGGNPPTPTNGYPLGNPPVPSAGCGKFPGLQSGTHTMTSAGLRREYIVSVPENYDANTPHRLVFGMHWFGGSAEAVAGWSKWFGLDQLDTEETTIFVAPQGYSDGSPWRGRDNRDHIFFDDLYTHLASSLCVDTSRVFSVGFSFGAMYTNALAQTHQDILRGVVVYATADYNIYFPKNTGKPLAYMGVHGLRDPTCPIESGRRSRDRFVANNGCTTPGAVPEARRGGGHVTFDYECPANYPVRWSTFDGAHTYPPNNTGTWVHDETWDFITQF